MYTDEGKTFVKGKSDLEALADIMKPREEDEPPSMSSMGPGDIGPNEGTLRSEVSKSRHVFLYH